MSKSRTVCISCPAYYGCKFYVGPFFISPKRDDLKAVWWKSLNFNPANILPGRFHVCGRHFTGDCLLGASRVKNAVPTLFHADNWNRMFDFKFDDSIAKEKLNTEDACSKSKSQKLDSLVEIESAHCSQMSDNIVHSESSKPSQGSLVSSQRSDLDISFEEPADASNLSDFKNTKLLVYGAELLTLFTKCFYQNCCSNIDPDDLNLSYFGSAVRIHWSCLHGHQGTWNSQPFLCNNSVAQGNVELSAAVVLSGNSFGKLSDLAECLNLRIHKSATHYKIQEKCVYPVIRKSYITHTNDLLNAIKIHQLNGGPAIELASDGQCDSPGFCAQFCTVSIMNLADRKIIGTAVKNVMEESVRNSSEMELLGLKSLLTNELKDIEIDALCTDKHSAIRRLMKNEFQHISHEFDIWHLTKNFAKRLDVLGLKRNCHVVLAWKAMLRRHLYWCCENAKSFAGENNIYIVLKELWLSCYYHVTNVHEWFHDDSFEVIHRCCHEPYSEEKERSVGWIDGHLPVAVELKTLIYDKIILDDLHHCTRNLCTSFIENFHSKRMKYLPKRVHFSDESMHCRSFLAVLDHNANVSTESEDKRYKRFNRATDSVRTVSKKKVLSFKWRDHLMMDILTCRQTLDENISSRNICSLAKPKSLCPKQQRPTLDSVIMTFSSTDENFDYMHSDDSDVEREI